MQHQNGCKLLVNFELSDLSENHSINFTIWTTYRLIRSYWVRLTHVLYNILQVCNYHQQFYRPENLCVIITGQIEPDQVFKTVKPFEDKILSKVHVSKTLLFQFSFFFVHFQLRAFSECTFTWIFNLGSNQKIIFI